MIGRYIKLEMRKNRLVFIALVSAFLVSLLAPYIYGSNRQLFEPTFAAFIFFWAVAGLSVCGAVLGGNAGAGLRAEAAENAEIVLPISHGARLAAAFGAVAAHAAFLVLLINAIAAVIGLNVLETTGVLWLMYVPALYVAAVAFIFAYVSRNGFLGGLIGVVFGWSFGLGAYLPWYLSKLINPFILAPGAAAAGIAGAVVAFILLTKNAGRAERAGLFFVTTITVCLLLGQFFSVGYVFYVAEKETHRFFKAFYATRSSIFVASRAGDLKLVSGLKAVPVLEAQTFQWSYFDWEGGDYIADAICDKDVVWILRDEKLGRRIMRGVSGGKFETVMTGLDDKSIHLMVIHGKVSVGRRENGSWYISPLEAGKAFEWTKMEINGWQKKFLAAFNIKPDDDLMGVSRILPKGRTIHWKLPGKISTGYYGGLALDWISVNNQFLIVASVQLEKGRKVLVFCYPDGKVKTMLESRALSIPYSVSFARDYDEHWNPLPDAKGDISIKYVFYERGVILHFIIADGQFLPPVDVEKVFSGKKMAGYQRLSYNGDGPLLHAEGSLVWLYMNGALVKYNAAAGKTEKYWDLTAICSGENGYFVVKDGFYLFDYDNGRLHFVDWNGAVAKVELYD